MLCTIVPRANAIHIFERAGKVKLIGIADHGADGADGQAAFGQQLCRPCHAVVQQESLRAFAHGIPEHLAEIAAVQSAEGGDILDGNIQTTPPPWQSCRWMPPVSGISASTAAPMPM